MKIICIHTYCGNFAEDKDIAKVLREEIILQAIRSGENHLILDFSGIDSSTQSFIHALISGIFQKYGEKALSIFEFKGCNEAIKSLIATVINYSLE